MAEKRKRRRQDENADPPTKEEYAVAKYLRFNCPLREGKLVGMSVQCFIASKAVDALLESKWGAGKSDSDLLFGNRHSCVSYCDKLLQKGLFHRAARVEKKKSDKSKKKKKLKDGEEAEPVEEEKEKDKKGKKEKKSKKEKDEGEKPEEVEKKPAEKEEKKEEDKDKKKKEKKLKLVMHEDQMFKDGDEVYVWIYDPVPLKTFIIGLLLVLGAIALCLFPLWPSEVRIGVYYLSLSGAVFVGVILLLIVVRFILFCFIWALTLGKHHFWFLPNLTEDVGFFDSFRPLYKHDYYDGTKTEKEKPRGKKSKESDESDKDSKQGKGDAEAVLRSKTTKDSNEDKEEQNGFELVEKEDVDQFEVDGEHIVDDEQEVDNENDVEGENDVDEENDDESPENEDDENDDDNQEDNSDENEPKKTK
ncbi:translocation protein SEC62-like [Liolophura sinensis]|uniref:translocation protein SEC62-like n=1 Tax=Liolophura sinensis TaxID=3198878 RepID=UPI00315869BB